ncbi:MAG TPA: hypothetical protein VGF32_05350 [Streptosporangiaceae bacterium]
MSGREEPPRMRVEFVTMDGPEGQALEERQLTVIKEILAWLHRQPGSVSQNNPSAA